MGKKEAYLLMRPERDEIQIDLISKESWDKLMAIPKGDGWNTKIVEESYKIEIIKHIFEQTFTTTNWEFNDYEIKGTFCLPTEWQ